MTTLYKPVLISSAEQAEALPDDAIVIGAETGERYTKTYDGEWWGVTEMEAPLWRDVEYDKIIALVPIEAEEEYKPDVSVIPPWPAPMPETLPNLSRYVTPWEEA